MGGRISSGGRGRLPGFVAEPPSLGGPLALSADSPSVHQDLPTPVAHGGKAPLPRVLNLGVAEETRCGVPFDAAPSYGGQAGRAGGFGAELAADHALSAARTPMLRSESRVEATARRYERVALWRGGPFDGAQDRLRRASDGPAFFKTT